MRGIAAEREAKRGELGDDRHARLRVVPLPLVHLPRLVQLVVPVLDRILEERALGEVADEALVVDVDAVDFGVDVRGGARRALRSASSCFSRMSRSARSASETVLARSSANVKLASLCSLAN